MYSNVEQDHLKENQEKIELDLVRLAEEFLGIETNQAGAFKWLELNETLLATLAKWRKRPYFCPYRPYHGKWILTCKSNLQQVRLILNKTKSIGVNVL